MKCECGMNFEMVPSDLSAHRTTCMYARIHDLKADNAKLRELKAALESKVDALEFDEKKLRAELETAKRREVSPEFLHKLDTALLQLSEMTDHAVRLRVCLITYGTHKNNCAMFPIPSGDCDCGLEANIQAVPGRKVQEAK